MAQSKPCARADPARAVTQPVDVECCAYRAEKNL
jgi:hypothetical protein